ncbi:MAG: AAA family ATPase [Symploca sp. SIO2D2]|nr:AAA family ATPase [Symploca sp. SIO2D2]
MADQNELLEHLNRLNLAQFEEVLFRLKIDPAIIPSSFAEQSIRAIRIIQRLKQEPEGLERLEKTLAEPAISIIGKQYTGYEIEAQVKQIVGEYIQQPLEGREAEKRRLDEFVRNNTSGVLLVTGAAGFGKSALLSHWQQTQQEDYFIVYHCFSYRYEKTRSLAEAYRHLLKQLYLYYNIRNGEFPNDENGMRDILVGMLREPISAESKGLVIVLDGLDEADKTFEPFFTELSAGVFIIAAARAEEGEEPKYLRNWTDNAQRLYLKRLSRKAISKWLEQIKELVVYSQNNDVVKRLDKITDGFPLYLRFLIDDLRQAEDVEQVLAQTPPGFEKYVEQQLERLDELDLPEQRWQFFALLAVAKGVLEKEDIKRLTQMRDRQLRQLNQSWQVTRWMQITEGKFYAFAHPLLATTFASQLGDDAEDALQNLIDYCAQWQDHHSVYALRYYTEHLKDLKQWEELYAIARDEEFFTTQRQKLPDEPDLPLKMVQLALWGKAKTDDVLGMAEFVLVHPLRLMQIAKESPLDILRAGSTIRALALVDKFNPQHCILWYLLLAWDLAIDATQDNRKMEQAWEILERLQQKDLPRLSEYWMNDCAAYLLRRLLVATKWTLTKLSRLILDDHGLVELYRNLAEEGEFAAAFDTAQQIDYSEYRAFVLTEMRNLQTNKTPMVSYQYLGLRRSLREGVLTKTAKAQAQAGNFTAALNTVQQIGDSYEKVEALIKIAKTQPTPENFAAILNTAQQIGDSYYARRTVAYERPSPLIIWHVRLNFIAGLEAAQHFLCKWALVLTEIAKAQLTPESFAAALETAQQIDSSYERALALTEIAKAQPTQENLAVAIKTAKLIGSSYYRALVLTKIAKAQTQAKQFSTAIKTAQQIDSSYKRASLLTEITKAQPTPKNFAIAFKTAQQIYTSYEREEILTEIAEAQTQAEHFSGAIKTAQQIDSSYQRAKVLSEIAQAQAQAEHFSGAIKTAKLIGSSDKRAKVLSEIAKAQPTPENFTAALKTAQQISNSYKRAGVLTEIAKAQAQAEHFTAALKTAQRIDSSYQRTEVLTEIAKVQPTPENFTAALETAQQISNSYEQAEVLTEIAKAQPTPENFTTALETAQQIDSSYKRAEALMNIAKAQIGAKLSKPALLTTEKIAVNRNLHLPDIAAAFIENDDKENFKRLLIPCAYYLDASFQMCGHLAKLYPEQATDIAKIVQKFQVS